MLYHAPHIWALGHHLGIRSIWHIAILAVIAWLLFANRDRWNRPPGSGPSGGWPGGPSAA